MVGARMFVVVSLCPCFTQLICFLYSDEDLLVEISIERFSKVTQYEFRGKVIQLRMKTLMILANIGFHLISQEGRLDFFNPCRVR